MKQSLLLTVLFIFSITPSFAQSDCSNAITVCGNTGYSGLTATGAGDEDELTFINNDCMGTENNSIWLRLPINTGGTLGFILTPTNPDIQVDFDFFIFGPNATCNNLGKAIRCSTSNPFETNALNNHTGMSEDEIDASEGPGEFGNNFVQWLTVQPGEVYFLVIDRPIGASDFDLQWTGTATFFEAPEFNNPQAIALDILKCDSDAVDDQKTEFDLTINSPMLINSQPDVELTYHENINDAILGINEIPNPGAYTNTSNPQTVFMRMLRSATECFETQEFNIEVTNPVVAGQPNDLELCDINETGKRRFNLTANDALIKGSNTTAAVTYYAVQADAQAENNPLPSTYESATGTIWARLENTMGCHGFDIVSFKVLVTPLPEINYTLDVVDFTNNRNSIRINMHDPEDYEFSINGSIFSDTFFFRNLEPGPYTVTISAKTGCKAVSEDVLILNYPRFFTPNGDNENEIWRIPYLTLQPQATVTIFDRYGKLIKGFKGNGGWDGTLDSEKLPSTDYWFVLQLDSGRTIKGHFAMIR